MPGTGAQVNLSWKCNSSNDTGVKVERATDAAFTQNLTLLTTTAAHATSYIDTTAAAGTSYFYRVRATNADGDAANSNTAMTLTNSSAYAAGLTAQFYNWTGTPSTATQDLSSYTPVVTRTDSQINYTYSGSPSAWATGVNTTNFYLLETGYVKITAAGSYTFYLASDDGSYMWLDGAALITTNDGGHGNQTKSASATLSVGYHALKVEYMQQGGGAGLVLQYSGPSITEQVVPAAALYHDSWTNTSPTWTGAVDTNWNNTANWSGGVVPGSGSLAVLSGTPGSRMPTLSQDISVEGLDILTAGWTINLNGHNLTIGNGGLQIAGGSTPTAKIDIGSGTLVLNYAGASPLQNVEGWIKAGEGTISGGLPLWDGTSGITSASAKSTAYTALGVRDMSVPLATEATPPTSIDGVPVGPNSVVVKYTWLGDLNLDGKVTYDDYSLFMHDFQNQGGLTMEWGTGDLTGDGHITYDDYSLLVAGYEHQGEALSADEASASAAGSLADTAAPASAPAGALVATAPAANAASTQGADALMEELRRTGGVQALAATASVPAAVFVDGGTALAVRKPADEGGQGGPPILTVAAEPRGPVVLRISESAVPDTGAPADST